MANSNTFYIKNGNLMEVRNFVTSITVKRSVARAITKFVEQLDNGIQQLQVEERKVIEENGAKINVERGMIDFGDLPDEKKLQIINEKNELYAEKFEIKSTYKEQFSVLVAFFKEWDGEVQPQQNAGMNAFYDALDEYEGATEDENTED